MERVLWKGFCSECIPVSLFFVPFSIRPLELQQKQKESWNGWVCSTKDFAKSGFSRSRSRSLFLISLFCCKKGNGTKVNRIPLETSLLWSIPVLLAMFTRASFGISTNSLLFIFNMLCLVLPWRLAPEAQENSSSVGRSRWWRWPRQARWPRWPKWRWSWIRGLQSMKCWVSGLRYERQKIKVYLDVHKAPYGI